LHDGHFDVIVAVEASDVGGGVEFLVGALVRAFSSVAVS